MAQQALLFGRMGRLEGRLLSRAMAGEAKGIRLDLVVGLVARQRRRLFAGGKKKEKSQYGQSDHDNAEVVLDSRGPFNGSRLIG
jgi:hypothetical protein